MPLIQAEPSRVTPPYAPFRPGLRAVVCIPLYGAHDAFVQCLRSVLAHTPVDVPILIADDAGPDPASRVWLEQLHERGVIAHDVHWSRAERNGGFVANANRAIALAAPADVVLVNSDVVVAAGWFDGLRDAAYSDTQVATATALSNHGSIVSVPFRNTPLPALPQDVTLDDAAARIRTASCRLYPELPTAVGHCLYLRRDALELVGAFDDAFSPGYGEEVDYSQRCLRVGLRHVLADDVLVLHHGQASLGVDGGRNPLQDEHERIIRSRYPYYRAAVEAAERDEHGPLGRALQIASRAITTLRVTIDGRCLSGSTTGTQVHTLELIGAVWRTKRARIRVLVGWDLSDTARDAIATMPGIELLAAEELDDDVAIDDIVHRPYQVTGQVDVRLLLSLGRRVVLTHQDLIAFRNPSYFPDSGVWLAYRELTREALAIADRVLFFSEHAAQDAAREGLVPSDQARVVHIGVDHQCVPHTAGTAPPAAAGLDGRPFLVVLGTDMHHKNRPFALALFERLRNVHGWDGQLVLAGPRVAHGSSAGSEAAWAAAHPGTARHVVQLAAVSDPVKAWLLSEAAAVLYPTTYEGFGLLPFEAATGDTPCFFAPIASLRELAPEAATLIPWDVEASTAAVHAALTDPERAAQLVAAVRAAATELTWDRSGAALVDAYDETLAAPVTAARATRDAELVRDARYWGLRHDIGPTGMALVEPNVGLLPLSSQRLIAALTRRRITRAPVVALLNGIHWLLVRGRALPPYDPMAAAAKERAAADPS